MGIKAKKCLYEGVIVPTAFYGEEAFSVLRRRGRRVLMVEESGGRVRGRPRLGSMDGVKAALGNRLMTVEAEQRQCAEDR